MKIDKMRKIRKCQLTGIIQRENKFLSGFCSSKLVPEIFVLHKEKINRILFDSEETRFRWVSTRFTASN